MEKALVFNVVNQESWTSHVQIQTMKGRYLRAIPILVKLNDYRHWF